MPRSNADEVKLLINRLGRTALKNLLDGVTASAASAPVVKRRKRRKKVAEKKESK